MKRKYLNINFIVGCYCYLLQVNASVDRRNSWKEITDYFSDKISPLDIAKHLSDNVEGIIYAYDNIPAYRFKMWLYVRKGLFCKFIHPVIRYVIRLIKLFGGNFELKVKLTKPQLDMLYSILIKTHELLQSENVSNNEIWSYSSKNIYCRDFLETSIVTCISHKKFVEHYNQAEHFQFLTIEQIAGNNWWHIL